MTSRQEKRITVRRQQIIDGAVRVFIEKGFHRTTTREIAEAAEVSEGTIYNYFESKDDILLGIVNQLADLGPRQGLLEDALEIDLRTFLRAHFVQRMTSLGDRYELFLAVLPEILNTPALRQRYNEELLKPATQMFEDHIRARVERGEIVVDDPALLTRTFVALLYGLQVMLIMDDPVVKTMWQQPEKMVTFLAEMFFDGVVREK